VIRAELAVAAISLAATVAVALDASGQVQTQSASPEPTIWDHNGSVMYLIAKGPFREFYYQKPRPGMLEVGARPGSLLFRGEIDNGQYSGTAYIFNPHCGQIPFQVKGPILDNDERIMLTGQAPRVGRNCRTNESYTSNLEFRRLKPNEVPQSQDQSTAAQAPTAEESKPEVPSTVRSELPSVSPAQPSVSTGQPSVTDEAPPATKDSSKNVVNPILPEAPTQRPFVTYETPSEAKDLDTYIWGATLIVAFISFLGFSIAKIVIKQGRVWDRVMR